jgi:hypothetical protein
MRKRDKLKVIMEANQRVENSYLKSKGLIKEDVSLSQNKELQDIAKDLASDPETLKKAIKELISMGVPKDVLVQSVKAIKHGESIDSIVKPAVDSISESYSVNEVEDKPLPTYKGDIESSDSAVEKKEDKNDYLMGSKVTPLSGAGIGGTLGAVLGSLFSAGVMTGGGNLEDPKTYLIPLIWVVAAAAAGGVVGKAIKKVDDEFAEYKKSNND